MHSELSTECRELFTWRPTAQAYVASALTVDKLERAEDASKMFTTSGSVYVRTAAGVTTISNEVARGARSVASSKPYGG